MATPGHCCTPPYWLWARDASGSFAASKVWSTGGQALGIAVSPDKTTIVVGGGGVVPGKGGQDGFVFSSQ